MHANPVVSHSDRVNQPNSKDEWSQGPPPVMSIATTVNHSDVAWPCFSFWDWKEAGIGGWPQQAEKMYAASRGRPFNQRIPQVLKTFLSPITCLGPMPELSIVAMIGQMMDGQAFIILFSHPIVSYATKNRFAGLLGLSIISPSPLSWPETINVYQVFWRGSDNGKYVDQQDGRVRGKRKPLVELSETQSDLVNAQFTKSTSPLSHVPLVSPLFPSTRLHLWHFHNLQSNN